MLRLVRFVSFSDLPITDNLNVGDAVDRTAAEARLKRSTRALTGSKLPQNYWLFAAGKDTHPGRLGKCIIFIGLRPAPRCHEAISSGAHVPDALVSAK